MGDYGYQEQEFKDNELVNVDEEADDETARTMSTPWTTTMDLDDDLDDLVDDGEDE